MMPCFRDKAANQPFSSPQWFSSATMWLGFRLACPRCGFGGYGFTSHLAKLGSDIFDYAANFWGELFDQRLIAPPSEPSVSRR